MTDQDKDKMRADFEAWYEREAGANALGRGSNGAYLSWGANLT